MKKNIKTAILLVLLSLSALGQQQPVQVITQLIPPYSTRVADYYTGNYERLIVTLTNQDLLKPQLRVRLRMRIEGQGVLLQTTDQAYLPEISLEAGIPLRLSLQDLAPYFDLRNLQLQGIARNRYTQDGQLPEGYYRFMFQAIEAGTGQVLSRPQYAMAWLNLSEPPLLNLPLKNAKTVFQEPQYTVFQWTPRHLASPNAAFAGAYEFTLVEIWDKNIPPEAAFQSSMPLYQTTSRSSSLLYGPGEPALLPGKSYAWRVRAIAQQGADELSLFKNNGYSEIFWFTLESNCKAPSMVQTSPLSHARAEISWLADMHIEEYEVAYRLTGNTNNAWFTKKTRENKIILTALQENANYEVKVGSICSNGETLYTEVKTFTSLMTRKVDLADCGIKVDVTIKNREPMPQLVQGSIIYAGDFEIGLIEVRGGDGRYSGRGYVNIPYLGLLRLAVRFDNIYVNTEGQLVNGRLESEYDHTEKGILSGKQLIEEIKQIATLINDLIQMTIDKDYAVIKALLENIKEQVEEYLPQEMKDNIYTAADKVDEAKKSYDQALQTKNSNDASPEEKEAADKELEKANKDYKEAVKQLNAAQKEAEKLISNAAKIIMKAIKRIQKEQVDNNTSINDYENQHKTFVEKTYEDQGLKSQEATQKSSFKLISMSMIDAGTEFIDVNLVNQAKSLFKQRKQALRTAIYKSFINYFSREENLENNLKTDDKINGKRVIQYVIENLSTSATDPKKQEEDIILDIKKMMEEDIEKLIILNN